MEYFNLPTEKIVKYDESGFAYLKCPVCNSNKMTTQLTEGGFMVIYCNADNINFRFREGKIWQIDISIYDLDILYYAQDQNKRLRGLFNKGLITYVIYLEAVKLSNSEVPESS